MTKPTEKNPALDNMITAITGVDRRKAITGGKCSFCGAIVDPSKLRDNLSRKEYRISGFCQKCQDAVFGGDE